MFASIRKRLCYANVTATLALVFAMSGGALAAGHYLLSSTSQISPKVLKALKGHEGKPGVAGAQGVQGAQGPAGVQGPAGPQGPQGAVGETGSAGPAGAVGVKGATGAQGAAGSPWTAGGTLPSGQTETGMWTTSGPEGASGVRAVLASFAIPLGEKPEFNIVGTGEGEGEPHANLPAGCKGNVESPKANPGNLCVFEDYATNVSSIKEQFVTKAGVVGVVIVGGESGNFLAAGSWAVTAK